MSSSRPSPRKRFSQNFLQDNDIIEQIIQVISPKMGEHFVEIGPGLGALTLKMLPHVGSLEAIELDRDLASHLIKACEDLGKLRLHITDALAFDFSTLTAQPHSLRIFGNLPYQISTPLLFHCMTAIDSIYDMHFMLQKEVVERLAAVTRTKAYGRLSVMLQYYCNVEPLFIVPNTAFYPQPKVTSQMVSLKPKLKPIKAKDEAKFNQVVKQAFSYRRKMLRNSLVGLADSQALKQIGIDANSRAEELTVEDFIRISDFLVDQ